MTSFLDRLRGRPEPKYAKAVTSIAPWANGVPLSSWVDTPQKKAAAYLRAYRVGWFNKAGRKISGDVGSLDWSISEGDSEEGASETVLDRPQLSVPFDALSPIDQLQRLLEKPNPKMTGRQLLQKVAIHHDFAGASCLWLEGGDFGLPTAMWPISPARMTPSRDKTGRLIGWVMDVDERGGGVPFTTDEILWTATATADEDDLWGVSVVEAVYSEVPLSDLMARHTANVLTTGGRLAGMMWPKDRPLEEAEFQDAQRAWRNVASDPDAARRLLIFPEPMEYAAGASTPVEIGIPELALLSRDNILTAFPISPYILGVPEPGGLNSGVTRQEDRRDYWEGTVHPRADLIEESWQTNLVSRYEAVTGQTYDLEIAEPDMDNAASLLEKVAALRALASAGFDEKESVKTVGLSHIKFTAIPAPPPVPQVLSSTVAAGLPKDQVSTTAKSVESERDDAIDPLTGRAKDRLTRFLADQRSRTVASLKAALPQTKAARALKADPEWWDIADENDRLTGVMREIYFEVGRAGLQAVADTIGRTVIGTFTKNVIADLLTYGGERVKDINARTLQALTVNLAEGTRRGYSLNQLIDGVPEEGYAGISGITLENGIGAFDELRAETIARTETMLSYNRATITGYREFGVQKLLAYDGDQDEECASRAGQEFSIDEAMGIEDHPNGTLVWSPVVEEKSWHEPTYTIADIENLMSTLVKATKVAEPPVIHVHNTPEITLPPVVVNSGDTHVDAPVINVHPPEMTIEPPTVVVNTGETHVAPAAVTVTLPEPAPIVVNLPEFPAPQVTVNLPEPKSIKRIERDAKGAIVRLVEE